MTENADPKFVYGTFLIGDKYAKGVLALHKSLLASNTTHPLIVFECDCSRSVIELLTNSGCIVQSVDRLTPPTPIIEKNQRVGLDRWNNTFTKLNILSLIQYKKIILLDSDMMVQHNIDHLFETKHMSAVAAGNHARSEYVDLNSGLMVIEPSSSEFEKVMAMLALLASNDSELSKFPNGIGDQDIIHLVYPNWQHSKELHLSEAYNLFQDCLTRYDCDGFIKPEKVNIVHFEMCPKPWDYSVVNYLSIIYRLIRYRSTAELKALHMYRKYLRDW